MHKKTSPFMILFFLSGLGTAEHAAGAMANENLQGLRVHTVEGVLRLKEEEIDLATAALIISRNWGTPKTLHTYRGKVDKIAADIQREMDEKNFRPDYRAIPIINEHLFGKLNFQSIPAADNPEDLFLHVVLDQKKGYCLSLSVLYLSIGERLGIPLCGVVVPGHFFVRYDDGQNRFNIETTAAGGFADDAHYRENFRPPADHNLYMKNLTKRQTLGCFFNNLGNCYSSIGNQDQAFLELSRAVEINPSLSEAHTNLGNIYLQRKQPDAAVREYEAALRILPGDSKILNNMGNAWIAKDNAVRAAGYYLHALEKEPEFADAHRNLSEAYRRQGLTDKAIAQIKTAIKYAPQDAENYLHSGRLYVETKDLPAAQDQFLKALLYNPGLSAARVELGQVYLKMKKTDWAIEEFTEAMQGGDEWAEAAYFGLAQVYHQTNESEKEMNAYQEVLRVNPANLPALQNLGNALLAAERTEEAIQCYQQGLELEPDNSDLHYNLAAAYLRKELYEPACLHYQSALKSRPEYAFAHHGLAVCFYFMKEYEKCRTHAQKAKELGCEVPDKLLKVK